MTAETVLHPCPPAHPPFHAPHPAHVPGDLRPSKAQTVKATERQRPAQHKLPRAHVHTAGAPGSEPALALLGPMGVSTPPATRWRALVLCHG